MAQSQTKKSHKERQKELKEHHRLQRLIKINKRRGFDTYTKEQRKKFWREHHMHANPIMGNIFWLIEEERSHPNGRTPFDREILTQRNVVYKTIGGHNLFMDIYYPSRPVGEKSPLVFMIPGGGWMIRNRVRRDGHARCFAAMGAVVAVIEHRLTPTVHFPDNLKDCVDAYNFMVDNADKFGIDKDNITLTGDSSGGHLCACLGCSSSSEEYRTKLGLEPLKTKPVNCIFISGAFSFEVMYRIPFTHHLIVRYFSGQPTRKAFRSWKFYKESDPYNYLNPDFPESYNNGGQTDLLCLGEAKRMANALTEAGVKNEFRVGKSFLNSSHCYMLRFPYASARRDALALYRWYCKKQAEKGVDMSDNFIRVERFMTQYKEVLNGEVEC